MALSEAREYTKAPGVLGPDSVYPDWYCLQLRGHISQLYLSPDWVYPDWYCLQLLGHISQLYSRTLFTLFLSPLPPRGMLANACCKGFDTGLSQVGRRSLSFVCFLGGSSLISKLSTSLPTLPAQCVCLCVPAAMSLGWQALRKFTWGCRLTVLMFRSHFGLSQCR